VRLPLLRYGRFPEDVVISALEEHLQIQATIADQRQLAAPCEPPTPTADGMLQLICHESAVNNTARAILGGRTRSLPDTLRQLLPTESPIEGGERGLTVTFNDSDPLRVEFGSDKVAIELSGTGFAYGYQGKTSESSTGIRISIQYQLEPNEAGWRLVLRDEPEIELFVSALRAVALRRILTNVLARDLPQHVDIDRAEPSLDFEGVGALHVGHVQLKGGWLMIGLHPPTEPAVQAAHRTNGQHVRPAELVHRTERRGTR
jgi:hypothetical protein